MSNEQSKMQGRGHYKLEAWKRARELVLRVYSVARQRFRFGFAAYFPPLPAYRLRFLVTHHRFVRFAFTARRFPLTVYGSSVTRHLSRVT